MTIRPLVAGNWKMNGLKAALEELKAMDAGYTAELKDKVELLICPSAMLVAQAADTASFAIGAQDCHAAASGAHTGDVAAEMVKDAGASYVILGHSERRTDHGESDAEVRAKTEAAWRAGLVAVVCVGEVEAERKAGKAVDVVAQQLADSLPDGVSAENTVVAYEPVWAIGTGLTPTAQDVEEIHTAARERLVARFGAEGEKIRILYGGSVKPANAKELLSVANVNGALVGGASLKATDFLGIAQSYLG
ncbi:triose-phosphate isomerase [Polycladidibacter stylochi]|uniref:triose-phosphate isomerase n=1 Tax=Polycladidibacter stylochi TaxID=1807766 RepID=UPI000834045B|nr:triose-phosphate isomerase [Pseudovibrio stylochi]